jgi:hypothetical protein
MSNWLLNLPVVWMANVEQPLVVALAYLFAHSTVEKIP